MQLQQQKITSNSVNNNIQLNQKQSKHYFLNNQKTQEKNISIYSPGTANKKFNNVFFEKKTPRNYYDGFTDNYNGTFSKHYHSLNQPSSSKNYFGLRHNDNYLNESSQEINNRNSYKNKTYNEQHYNNISSNNNFNKRSRFNCEIKNYKNNKVNNWQNDKNYRQYQNNGILLNLKNK